MRVAAVESTTLVTVSYDDARECCNSSSVAGRFTNISISPRRCISRCWMLHPRGAISIRPFGFPCRLISISLPLRSVGKYLPGAIVEEIQMARTLAELQLETVVTAPSGEKPLFTKSKRGQGSILFSSPLLLFARTVIAVFSGFFVSFCAYFTRSYSVNSRGLTLMVPADREQPAHSCSKRL